MTYQLSNNIFCQTIVLPVRESANVFKDLQFKDCNKVLGWWYSEQFVELFNVMK